MLNLLIGCRAAGIDYPSLWDAKGFNHPPSRALTALAARPQDALKETLCRQLVSLAALERLEPQKHVAVTGKGPVVSKLVQRGAASWLNTLGRAPLEGANAAMHI